MFKNKMWIVVVGVLLVYGILFYLDVYKILVFDIHPHDNYENIVKYFQGELSLGDMISPYFYRFGYTYPAFLFSKLDVLLVDFSHSITFTRQEKIIFQGLAMVNTLSFLGLGALTFLISQTLGFGRLTSLVVLLINLELLKFTAFFGIDPTTIVAIVLLYFFCTKEWYQAAMVALLLSFLINEKIGPIFFVFGGINYFLNRKKMDLYFVVVPSLISIISYLVLIKIVPLDNFPSQMDFLSYPYRFVQSFRSVFTGQGMLKIALPLVIFSIISYQTKLYKPLFITLVFWTWGMCLSMQNDIGRMVMITLPFYIPSLNVFVEKYFGTKVDIV